jgi:hypothetical protein
VVATEQASVAKGLECPGEVLQRAEELLGKAIGCLELFRRVVCVQTAITRNHQGSLALACRSRPIVQKASQRRLPAVEIEAGDLYPPLRHPHGDVNGSGRLAGAPFLVADHDHLVRHLLWLWRLLLRLP